MENSEAPEVKTIDTEHVSFDLTLDNQVSGEPVLENPVCHFHYDWNKKENMGIAMLQTINGTPVNIVLHPLGIEGQLDFMSDMEPTHFTVNANNGEEPGAMTDVIIYRVILDVVKSGNEAAIMFNQDGSSIQSTKGFMEESAAKQLPPVEFETPSVPEK